MKKLHDFVCAVVLAIGLALHIYDKKLKQSHIIILILVLNTVLGFQELFELNVRFGIDYIAYIHQARAAYSGERNFTKLSSQIGPCYYPAGHIWHYIPAVWLHMQTDHAETIIKVGHQFIHSLIIIFVTKISYVYFRDSKDSRHSSKGQLIAFILLTNPGDHKWYGEMFNDEIMALYLVVCIYLTITNRPILASFFFTLALSIKAGPYLLMPAFLGAVHFNYGTIVLLTSVALIIGFQVLVALPFLLGDTSVKDYLSRS